MAHISTMPDIWGSRASSSSTGTRGSRGTASSRTIFWYSQPPTLPTLRRAPGPSWGATGWGVRLARWAVSRIISNLTSSDTCRVGRPLMFSQRRQPLRGSQNRTATSSTRLIR